MDYPRSRVDSQVPRSRKDSNCGGEFSQRFGAFFINVDKRFGSSLCYVFAWHIPRKTRGKHGDSLNRSNHAI